MIKKNPTTTRRRVCQAMAVLGSSALAGCASDEEEDQDQRHPPGSESETRTADNEYLSEDESDTRTADEDDGDPDPPDNNSANIIRRHINGLDRTSFTMAIGLQDYKLLDGDAKQLEYEYSPTETTSVLFESVDRNDGVDYLEHVFENKQHDVRLQFDDGDQNHATLGVEDGPLYIDGSSILDRYLAQAGLSEGQTLEQSGDLFYKYTIQSHRGLDDAKGELIVSEDGVIESLEIEWTADDRADSRLSIHTSKVGSTEIHRSID